MYNFLLYLAYIQKKLSGFFERQYPYIKCRKGCAKCCKNGEYPFSHIEYEYIMLGFIQLPEELRKTIIDKIMALKTQKAVSKEKTFTHECPFLIDNICSVYNFRGIICRCFGLISINDKGNSKIPFCAFEGLNYSNVLNPDTKIISSEKYEKLKQELGEDIPKPLAFNSSYGFLTSEKIEKNFNFSFGDKKPLLDWFDEDFYNAINKS